MKKSKTVNFYTDQEKHAIIKDYLTSGKSVKERELYILRFMIIFFFLLP